MQKSGSSVKRVLIKVIIGILICILVLFLYAAYRNANRPFNRSYKKQLIEVCENADVSLNYYKIESYGDGYKVSFHTNTAGLVYAGALQDAVKVFNDIADFADEHDDFPMHDKDMTVYVDSNKYGISFGEIEISYCSGKTAVIAASSQINSSVYGSLVNLKYGLNYLSLYNNTIFDVDTLLFLDNLEKLEFIDCRYLNGETAPNDTDIAKLKDAFGDIEIIVK